MVESMENIYEEVEQTNEGENGSQEEAEEQKTVEGLKTAQAETGKINGMLESLNKNFGQSNSTSLEIICNGLNETAGGNNANFEVITTEEGNQEIGLVLGKGFEGDKEELLDSINSSIRMGDGSNGLESGGYFIDKSESNEQGNLNYDSGEFGIDNRGNIEGFDFSEGEGSSSTDVESRVEKGEEVTEGQYFEEGGNFYYKVGNEGDPGAAILRQLTVLSNELELDLGGYEDTKSQVENLYFSDSDNEFFSANDAPEGTTKVSELSTTIDGEKKEGIDALNYMVDPGDKIDISSLAEGLKPDEFKEASPDSKEFNETNIEWGNFFVSGGVEHWDLPDSQSITYEGYDGSPKNTNGSNLEITAKNLHDMESGSDKENEFNNKIKITDNGKSDGETIGYLVVGEPTNFAENSIDELSLDSPMSLENAKSKDFSETGVEAWLATSTEGGMNIKEVGDKNVHEFVRTNNTIESGKSANNPIYLDSGENNVYTFETGTSDKGNITFDKPGLASLFEGSGDNGGLEFDENGETKLNSDQIGNILNGNSIDDIFANTDSDTLFFEFNELIESEDGIKDATLQFEKIDDGLKISKLGEGKSLESSDEISNQEIVNRTEIIKGMETKDGITSIETQPLKGFGSYEVNINENNDMTFKQGDISFEVKNGPEFKSQENYFNFFDNGGFLKCLIGASVGSKEEICSETDEGDLYIDYNSINDNFSKEGGLKEKFRERTSSVDTDGQSLMKENLVELGFVKIENTQEPQLNKLNELKEKDPDIKFSNLEENYINDIVSELNSVTEKGEFSFDSDNNKISYSYDEENIDKTFDFNGEQKINDFKSWLGDDISSSLFISSLEDDFHIE